MTASTDLFARVSTQRSGATFSPDRRYRYHLWRCWGSAEHRCAWLMLNPSSAGESEDDPTIRKCIGFAKGWGYSAIDVVNLFALVSTDPAGLLRVEDPVGDYENGVTTETVCRTAHRVVIAYGRHNVAVSKLASARARALAGWLPRDAGCLGRNSDGSPRHPLMLAYSTRFEAM